MNERVKIVEINGVEYLAIETPEKPVKPEFRLYYDEMGKVLFYSMENISGNYIVVDKQIFAEARYDWKVIDGKLTKYVPGITISKLKPDESQGMSCAKEDISIIVDENYNNIQKWKLTSYELR